MNGQAPAACDISVAVFCQNEAARIGACLSSIASAGRGFRLGVTVIANGSTDDSLARALTTLRAEQLPARLYAIAHGDKSNAINHSFYTLRQAARLHVFIDGYAVIAPDAFSGFAAALSANKHAVAATGVSGNGRTMKTATEETLRDGGRLHGQLHAFRPAFLNRLTEAGLRLPIGLYRGDGLLGSMACHDLAPLDNPWDGHRIKGTVEATYEIPALSVFRPRDIARQLRRKVRQMRGRMENAAMQGIIYSKGYAALPDDADEMIAAWLEAGGRVEVARAEQPFMRLALRQIARRSRPEPGALQPVLVHETS
jgi:glycosyltransferase involved in cell wall biosynthesis